MENYKMYIIVNQEVGMGKGKIAGQVGHAVASYMYRYKGWKIIDRWMAIAQTKIIVKGSKELCERLEIEGYVAIRDAGHTQIEAGTLTAINVGIYKVGAEPDFVKELRLL